MEARQLQFIEESKVFQTSLVNFLMHQFPADAPFFPNNQAATPSTNQSALEPSVAIGKTEMVYYSSNAAYNAFDWNTPYERSPSPQPIHLPMSWSHPMPTKGRHQQHGS
ncbi:hypothetical protein V6N12_012641 [Hibiscus sabdariffa]|uniref:Uncharacterized protein n=1 Tax=Hibiscus sabdariffa TaxID=183260 RepID=A0ABR2DG32_9ROSI